MRSSARLGECPSAEAQQLKAVLGICKESGAKPDRAAEQHQAPSRLKAQSSLSSWTGHTSQDTPHASGAEGRKPQPVKRPLHEIPVEARHDKGIHLA